MKTRKVTDKAIASANKIFTFIDDVQEKTIAVETCAEETKETILSKTNPILAQWQAVAQTALKGGVKLALNQQNIAASTYETLKDELAMSYKRTVHLVRTTK